MFRTILAGCNGFERGRGAVSLAHAIASATGARLVLLGVHHNPPLPFPDTYAEQHAALERALRAVRDELAPQAIVRVHADLSPARALRHVAEAEHADLIVVGSRHRRRLQHILEGDRAMQVLHGAACAVAIAPDPLAPHPELQKIGIGIDATPESERALALARDLAERTGAHLWLHAVVDDSLSSWDGVAPMGGAPDVYETIIASRVSMARDLLAERLEACRGLPADGTVVVGSPTGELVLASEGLDLLVLGSRRWGPVRRLALGSTSERVIRHTACPVLVPPREGASEHGDAAPVGDETAVR
jgi:nucleotide-binding universal stress UspA family protein